MTSRMAMGCSQQTVKWYRHIFAALADCCPLLPSRPEEIERFLLTCPGGDERRHGYFRALRALYHFIAVRYQVAVNPMDFVAAPRRKKKKPRILSPMDIYRLLAYPHKPLVRAALLFLIDTGARIGELHGLRPADLVETANGYGAIVSGKTGARYVPVSPETYHALQVALPFTYKVDWLTRVIAAAFREAGVKGTAHTIRHTFATLWGGNDITVLQQIMGHSTLAMTQHYRQIRAELINEQHRQYSPLRAFQIGQPDMFGKS